MASLLNFLYNIDPSWKKKRMVDVADGHSIYVLTECVHTRQKLSEMAKSWILMTLGWVDILMGGVHHTKYFWTRITLSLVGAHPNFEVTKENQLLSATYNFFLVSTI